MSNERQKRRGAKIEKAADSWRRRLVYVCLKAAVRYRSRDRPSQKRRSSRPLLPQGSIRRRQRRLQRRRLQSPPRTQMVQSIFTPDSARHPDALHPTISRQKRFLTTDDKGELNKLKTVQAMPPRRWVHPRPSIHIPNCMIHGGVSQQSAIAMLYSLLPHIWH